MTDTEFEAALRARLARAADCAEPPGTSERGTGDTTRPSRPPKRTAWIGVAAAVVVLTVAVGVALLLHDPADVTTTDNSASDPRDAPVSTASETPQSTEPPNDAPDQSGDSPTPDGWATLDPGPLEPRSGATIVSLGNRLLVIGGERHSDAAIYEPATDQWSMIATPPFDPGRPAAVWTGSQLFALGRAGDDRALASYDPDSNSWSDVLVTLPGERTGVPFDDLVWTGTEIVVIADFVAYEPGTGQASTLPSPPILPMRTTGGEYAAAWTPAGLVLVNMGSTAHLLRHDGQGWADGWETFDGPGTSQSFGGAYLSAAVVGNEVVVIDEADQRARLSFETLEWASLEVSESTSQCYTGAAVSAAGVVVADMCDSLRVLEPGEDWRRVEWHPTGAYPTVGVVGDTVFQWDSNDEGEPFVLFHRRDLPLDAGRGSPRTPSVFATETGAVLILDDGFDGVTVVDLDGSTATRVPIGGSAGDQPYRLWLTGDSLVAGWGSISVAPLPSLEPQPLDEATIFVPSPDDGHVWLIDYPGGRIGAGQPTYTLVSVHGEEVLSEPGLDPADGFPAIGYADGLVLETDDGILLWRGERLRPVSVPSGGAGAGFISDASDRRIAWCGGRCTELRLTDPLDTETLTVDPPANTGSFEARSARFSPDGTFLAAIALDAESSQPNSVVLIDAESGSIVQEMSVESLGAGFLYLTWRSDGSEVFFSAYSWSESSTTIGRLNVDGAFEVGELPFGSALASIVVDRDDIDLGEIEPVAADRCPAPDVQPSGRTDRCTFGF